jgi:ribose transport system permease protein
MKNIIGKITKFKQFPLIIVLIIVVGGLTAIQPNYFSVQNFIIILFSASIVGLVTIGQSYLIIAGQIDLSPGAIAAFSGVFGAVLLQKGLPTIVVIMMVIGMAALIGYINSVFVNVLKMDSFIVTVAAMSVFTGLSYIIGGGMSVAITNESFIYFGAGKIFGIPNSIIIFAIIFVIFLIILTRTRFGRSVYMIGGNETAARLAGINPKKVKLLLFMLTPVMASIGGMIVAGRMNSGQPSPQNYLMFGSITAAVVGGIKFGGGKGSLWGALTGVILLEAFNNGIAVLNISSFWQSVASGLLLIVALTVDYIRTTRSK